AAAAATTAAAPAAATAARTARGKRDRHGDSQCDGNYCSSRSLNRSPLRSAHSVSSYYALSYMAYRISHHRTRCQENRAGIWLKNLLGKCRRRFSWIDEGRVV